MNSEKRNSIAVNAEWKNIYQGLFFQTRKERRTSIDDVNRLRWNAKLLANIFPKNNSTPPHHIKPV